MARLISTTVRLDEEDVRAFKRARAAGGPLWARTRAADGRPGFPAYEAVLTSASLVIVPALVLAEVDYFGPRFSQPLELLP